MRGTTVKDVDRIDFAKRLGRRIRDLRLERGLAPAEAAWEAEPSLSRYHLSNIEAGRRVPSLQALCGLAERIGVEPFELLILPGSGALADVVDLARRLPPHRLRDLHRALKREVSG